MNTARTLDLPSAGLLLGPFKVGAGDVYPVESYVTSMWDPKAKMFAPQGPPNTSFEGKSAELAAK